MKVKDHRHIISVDDCPRCGKDHEGLLWQPLTNPDDEEFWAFCPEASEPVLASAKDLGISK
jgi:hypothetical protein